MRKRSMFLQVAILLAVVPGVPLLTSPPSFADSSNVAIGAEVAQSSTRAGALASRAVDGNTNGNFGASSVTHTESEAQAWWSADLKRGQGVTEVKIWNRTDCCAGRLTDFYLLASDLPITSTNLTTARSQAGVTAYHVSALTGNSVSIAVNRSARYLRVQLAGTGYLSLAEVQVLSSGETTAPRNLAAAGHATQSSTNGGALATRANDANTDGAYAHSSVSHTGYNSEAWWALDLRSTQPLTSVKIWNRTDCCSERLSNFYLLASDTPITSTTLATARNQPGVSSYHVNSMTGSSVTIPVNRSARYLRVQLVGTNYLSLAEVEVYGASQLMRTDAEGWVNNNNFGMFLHFNMSTYTNEQWANPNAPATSFNPTNYDPGQWADAMVSAKMKFGVLTVKHTDGFALWPTKQSNYSVASSGWRNGNGDAVREYVDALRSRGLKVGFYYCFWDRHNGQTTESILNTLRELLTEYGTIDYLWIDCWGEPDGPRAGYDQAYYDKIPFAPVRKFIREVSAPTVVANNDYELDYATTDVNVWEQDGMGIPTPGTYPGPKEVADMLDTNRTWFYTTTTGAPKSASSVVNRLTAINADEGEYLLNVGPDSTGRIPQAYVDRLREIGNLQ